MNQPIQDRPDFDRRLTVSEMVTANTCWRKLYMAYVLGIRSREEDKPLRIGRIFHLALDLKAQGQTTNDAILTALRHYDCIEPTFDLPYERETVARLLSAYFWRWEAMDTGLETVETEMTFEDFITNPETGGRSRTFTIAGKIDKIVRILNDGRLAVIEHKTTGSDISVDSDYWKRLAIDSQITTYYLGATAKGYPIATVLYDVIRKPLLKPCQIPLLDDDGVKIVLDANGERVKTKDGKKWRESSDRAQGFELQSRIETPDEYGTRLTADIGERPDFYFARREISRTARDLAEHQARVWILTQELLLQRRLAVWPKNDRACVGFGRCQYFELCTSGFDPDHDLLPETFRRVNDVHQELVEE